MFLSDPMVKRHLEKGGAIRRSSWNDKDYKVDLNYNDFFEDPYLEERMLDYYEMIANDWEIV